MTSMRFLMGRCFVFLAVLLLGKTGAFAQPKLTLEKDDHIALIGGTLPERFQHSGYLETAIVARHAKDNLVFRNLAVSGDEVVTRHRSANFGTPDEWLARVQASVIFAYFGFNESFKGPEGLEQFKRDLERWVQQTKGKNFSGKGAPKIVLFSPIANERHQDVNFPDPRKNNENILLFTAAIADVAQKQQVAYIDLYAPSQKLFADAAAKKESLTINGLHLSPKGDEALAGVIFQQLFNEPAPTGDYSKLRAAINDKNEEWHSRYRTIDGYNVYGGRSQLEFESQGKGTPKVSNYKIMQEEMTQRDVMTANRDKRVWAVANGTDLVVDDSNLPPVQQIKSNKPGPEADETWPFLGGEEAISKMTVHSGMKVNLFADESRFPELSKPLQMMWDTKGRLWVSTWPNYPERTPTSKTGDRILIFEDTDDDGKADKMSVFMDDLNAPTGFQFYKDGLLVMQAPSLWYVRDTDGDGKADWKERILMGMDSADSHHTANAICYEPGGAIYLSDGVFHRTQVETPNGPLRNNDAAIYRFEPRTGNFITHAAYGFANPHGRVFDYWGNDLITDATGNNTYFGPAFSGHIDYPAKHTSMKEFWDRPSRPCPGTGILTSRHFPEEFQNNFLNINVISFQGIYRVKVSEDGSGLRGQTMENLISSTDPNFRPICINMGPEGAIYFADWHNPIIGHMQHHLRDPNRDKVHGRIYRITYEGRPFMKRIKFDGMPIEGLLDLLKEPENDTRELAKIELGKRDSKEVIAATKKWAAQFKNDAANAHHLLEALWVHQWHNVVDVDLLKTLLQSPEPKARAQAVRVLGYWRDRVPEPMSAFKKAASDSNPRVRLEAVRVASFYRSGDAAEMALECLKQPLDYYLDYTLKETLKQLEPYWRKAISEGQGFAADNPAGINHLIGSVNNTELLKMPKTPQVLDAIINRPGITDADRSVALDALATSRKVDRVTQLLEMLKQPGVDAGVSRLLPFQVSEDLKKSRTQIAALAREGSSPETRQAAWASLALADDSFKDAWSAAEKDQASLVDLLYGISFIPDAAFRAKAYDLVKPILAKAGTVTTPPTEIPKAKIVRIELPRKGTLTLAEVEIMSGGQNVARAGRARQSTTSNRGNASRAIDGNTGGSYGGNGQTHTQEDQDNPWWEVDLGSEKPVEAVTVWNRTDEQLGKRLDGFTLRLIDGNGREVFRKDGLPAPAVKSTIAISRDIESEKRRGAIRAAVSMNHEPAAVFEALANIIATKQEVIAASQGLRALPRASWPKESTAKVANGLVAWAETIPASGRTAQDYVETVQFATDVAGYLPPAQASPLRAKLKELRVPVFVVRAVREQMRFDTPRIVVETGKAFEIIFENADFMPHNLVVVRPGTREKVGDAAALMKPDQLDGRGRAYVPDIVEVISATRLIDSNLKQTLALTAPNDEGECEFVCTFPGHYQLMWGKLIVTKDVDAYLQAHPEAPAVGAGAPAGHKHLE